MPKTLREVLSGNTHCITDGAIYGRVNSNMTVDFDPYLAQSSLLYSQSGQSLFREVYRGYFKIAQKYNLPMLTLAPTWRANGEKLRLSDPKFRNSNVDGVRFMKNIRSEFEGATILIGGDLGSSPLDRRKN